MARHPIIFGNSPFWLGSRPAFAVGGGGAPGSLPPEFIESSNFKVGTSLFEADIPASAEVGDLLLIFQVVNYMPDNAMVPPGGWALLKEKRRGGATGWGLGIYYRIADGTEPATVSLSSQGRSAGLATCAVWRGVDLVTPVINGRDWSSSGTVTTYTLPSMTTLVDNSVVVGVATNGFDASQGTVNPWRNESWPTLTGLTEFIDVVHPYVSGNGLGAVYGTMESAGDTGNGSIAFYTSDDFVGAISFAIQPA